MKKLLAAMLVALLRVGCGDDGESGEDSPESNQTSAETTPAKTDISAEGKPFTIPDLSMEMLWCKPGTFTMGSPKSEEDRELFGTDETQHTVTLTKGFWLGKHEVTQTQWQSIMKSNPSEYKGANHPVEKVSWKDATAFCYMLTERERNAGRLPVGWAFALPTEAQWEYACRAGTKTAYSFGAAITEKQVNIKRNIGKSTSVGSYPANAWGFHDMHGNVWEWCHDWYGKDPTGSVTDPMGPASGSLRVKRGGSWRSRGHFLRSARRSHDTPGLRRYYLGFRVALRFIGE